MHRTSFFILLFCILKCILLVSAICVSNNASTGTHAHLQCTNITLNELSNQSTDASTVIIVNSNLGYIMQRAFTKYAKYLQSLNLHNCRINDIHAEAFDTLASLKKLSLPNNNLTRVKEEWFRDLVYLEQLDLSFNQIARIEPAIFDRVPLLKRLDVRENRLICLDYSQLPGGIDKLYFVGNPLSFICRGKLTLWMRDHGVRHKTELSEKESWLDKLLWLCAMGDAKVAKSEDLSKECVILNLFNQLRTGLTTAESYPLTTNCQAERNNLTECIISEARRYQMPTNGNFIKKLLLYLHQTKLTI